MGDLTDFNALARRYRDTGAPITVDLALSLADAIANRLDIYDPINYLTALVRDCWHEATDGAVALNMLESTVERLRTDPPKIVRTHTPGTPEG